MTNVSSSNALPSDTASLNVPQTTRHYNTTDQGAFLAQQAADAKTAMQRTVADMQTTLQEAADVRWWTQQYPWYAVGAAALAGFVAARQVRASADRPAAPQPVSGQMTVRPSWTSSLFDMLRTAVMGAVMEAVRSSSEKSDGAPAEHARADPRAPRFS